MSFGTFSIAKCRDRDVDQEIQKLVAQLCIKVIMLNQVFGRSFTTEPKVTQNSPGKALAFCYFEPPGIFLAKGT